MNYFQNLLCAAIIVVYALFTIGPSNQSQAASSTVEPEQFSCANVTEIPQSECEALVALYNETDGSNWENTTGWLDNATPCNWYGVACEDGYTTGLNLAEASRDNRFGLQGTLPAEIGNLTNLTTLELHNNQLSSLPPEIGKLTNLTTLSLSENQLSSLPSEIGKLTNLRELFLSSNRLNSLPAEIVNLTNLTWLHLSYNRLVIPEGNLHSFVTAHNRDWASTQTIAPTEVKATLLDNERVELSWTPIAFQDKDGYYEINIDGGELFTATTTSKSNSSHLIDGLVSGTTYDIRIRTYTPAHDYQPTELWSDYSPVVSATTLDSSVDRMIS